MLVCFKKIPKNSGGMFRFLGIPELFNFSIQHNSLACTIVLVYYGLSENNGIRLKKRERCLKSYLIVWDFLRFSLMKPLNAPLNWRKPRVCLVDVWNMLFALNKRSLLRLCFTILNILTEHCARLLWKDKELKKTLNVTPTLIDV